MEKWLGEACGNTFLVIFHRADFAQVTMYLDNLRQTGRWHFDSALVVSPLPHQSVSLRVLEKDGSESAMCGNGVRVVAKILVEKNLPPTIQTAAAKLTVRKFGAQFACSMGSVKFVDCLWLSGLPAPQFHLYTVCGEPHAVTVVPDADQAPLSQWGSQIAPHANCTVTSFVAPGHIKARTFERGVNNITQSCGTGACAAAHVMRRHCRPDGLMLVHMHNHQLKVARRGRRFILSGPASAKPAS